MIRLVTEQNRDICCWLADSNIERQEGLNGWGELPPGAGLLFVFGAPKDVAFHMSDVTYPIDIVMLDKNANIKEVYADCQPGSDDIYPGKNIKWVLELVSGEVRRLGLREGESLRAYEGAYEFNNTTPPELLAIHAAYNATLEGNEPYGACICHGSTPVGWGWNRVASKGDPTLHGEIVCMRDVIARGSLLENSEMYTTHLPCMMCMGATAWAEISKVYYLKKKEYRENTVSQISESIDSPAPKFRQFGSRF